MLQGDPISTLTRSKFLPTPCTYGFRVLLLLCLAVKHYSMSQSHPICNRALAKACVKMFILITRTHLPVSKRPTVTTLRATAISAKQLLFPVAGQKGSDVSAREATKKVVAATKQMHALEAVLQDIHVLPLHAPQDASAKLQASDENAKSVAAEAGPWAARNTIVRDVLNELTNAAHKSRRTRLQGIPRAVLEHRGSPSKQ